MKILHLKVLASVLLFSVTLTLNAQTGFNSKKKNGAGTTTITSSLNAKQIRYRRTPSRSGSKFNAMNTLQRSILTLPQNTPHKILSNNKYNLPGFIESKRDNKAVRLSIRKDSKISCVEYLQELQPLIKVDHPETNFIIQKIRTDNKNKDHIRLQQYYKDVPVYGAEVMVHLNEFGEGESFNGAYLDLQDNISTTPDITAHTAIERVITNVSNTRIIRPLNDLEKSLVQHAEPQTTLCVYGDRGLVLAPTLAYHVVYCPSVHARLEYFIDAHNGAVLNHFNSTCFVDGPRTASATDLNGTSRTINTYQKGSTYFMLDASRAMFNASASKLPDDPVGGILTIDLNNTFGANQSFKHVTSTNNSWANATAVSAHFNAGVAYNYYLTKHNRKSIDGNSGTIISIINTPDEDGTALDNAFWNGKAMFYGNGKTSFKALAAGLDVAGHEMTHGVVQNTANLEYQGESGAINESMADIFGTMMDPADWLIGEDVVKISSYPSGALRSLADPHNGGSSLNDPGFQPSHVNEKYNGSEDNGGVHVNSGIPNHAFYLYAEAITRDKAIAVFYKVLDDYLTKSSQFIDLRLAVIKAAGDLYGVASNEVTQAGIAFDAVGIGNGQGGNYTETLPVNPGSEFLLVYSTDPTDPNSLYRMSGSTGSAISTTLFASRPSVTDDGSAAVFVAGDHTIHAIITDPSATQGEFILQSDPIWSNAVISKGGNRLAAVTKTADKSIHVYDFTTETWGSFELYNPTFSEGVTSGGPLYSDALEWDYSGEYLVYDAFNSIKNSSGSNIEYWDVNFMHVWDIASADFSDGEIAKLFSSLPDGVSIGNPSFAKTTPNVIAFDYVDENEVEYAVLGMNIETNDINVVASNNTLGFPSYNKGDTKIAFTVDDGAGNTETGYVNLNSDKISSNNVVTGLFTLTSWPVYYSVGDRGVGGDEVTGILRDTKPVTLSCYPNPFTEDLSVQLNHNFIQGKIEITNLMGQRINDFSIDRSVEGNVVLKTQNLPAGQYILHIQNGKKVGSCKVIKMK